MSLIVRPPLSGILKPATGGGGGGVPCSLLAGVPATNLQFDHVGACVVGSDGADLTLWVDSSSAANDLSNVSTSTCANIKAAFLNAANVVQYGANEAPSTMALDSSVTVSAFTYIAVIRCTVDTSGVPRTLIGNDGNNGGASIRIFQGKISFVRQGVANIGSSTTSMNTSTFYTVGLTYDGTNAAFYLNGSADGTASSAQTFTQPIRSQGAGNANENYIGYIAEDLLWDAVLSGGDLTTVFSALQARWAHY